MNTGNRFASPFVGQPLVCLAILVLGISSAVAQPKSVAQEITDLVRSARPTGPNAAAQLAEAPRLNINADGYVRHLGAAPGHSFPGEAPAGAPPEAAARGFLKKHARAFGVNSPAIGFAHLKTKSKDQRAFVRFAQTYAGIPVFGAQVNMQLDDKGQIESVLSDIESDTKPLDERILSTTPTLSAEAAAARVKELFAAQASGQPLRTTDPHLLLYSPAVLGENGRLQLTWDIDVASEDGWAVNEQVLLDAHTGEIACQIPKIHDAINRLVYDANTTTNTPGTLVRSEGQSASGIMDADNVYAYLGHTYSFYLNNHARDSVNGAGMTISVTVRYCSPNPTNPAGPAICPMKGNAAWGDNRIHFGAGRGSDDVTAHEYTHGVTAYESGLIYRRISGAINESFSDVWGEFVDLVNGAGDDSSAVRWLIAEDWGGSGIRDMQDPPQNNDPDRLSSPFYYHGTNDNGGVHINSGVNNKLCYLLTDGDTFNGRTVDGMGIGRVADLYYEVQTHLLTAAADWRDLSDALRQAAVNLGWTLAERDNLLRACQAVEIAYGHDVYVDKNSDCAAPNGNDACIADAGGPFHTLATGVSSALAGDRLHIRVGSYNEPMTLNKAMTVRAYIGNVVIGQ
jgi:bacillolysin